VVVGADAAGVDGEVPPPDDSVFAGEGVAGEDVGDEADEALEPRESVL
jgi:hypothetical protein